MADGLGSFEVIERLEGAGVAVTYRKLDHWTRLGVVSPASKGRSGSPRAYDTTDLEVLYAAAQLFSMGANHRQVAKAAKVIRKESVRHGEILVMSADLTVAYRMSWDEHLRFASKACWVVPLRSFRG